MIFPDSDDVINNSKRKFFKNEKKTKKNVLKNEYNFETLI